MAMRNDTKVFGNKIKAWRQDACKSQTEFGADASMGISNIQRIERARIASIQSTSIPALAAAMKLSLSEFKAQFVVPDGQQPDDPMELRSELFDIIERLAALEDRTPSQMMWDIASKLGPPAVDQDIAAARKRASDAALAGDYGHSDAAASVAEALRGDGRLAQQVDRAQKENRKRSGRARLDGKSGRAKK